MKKFLTLRNVIIWTAALIGLVMFFVSFALPAKMVADGLEGTLDHVIWGFDSMTAGSYHTTIAEAYHFKSADANGFGLVGFLFTLISALALVVAVFLIKKEKIAKIVIFASAGLMLVGGIFQLLVVPGISSSFVNAAIRAYGEGARQEAKAVGDIMQGYCSLSGGSIVCAILTFVAAIGAGASQFVPDKQLVK